MAVNGKMISIFFLTCFAFSIECISASLKPKIVGGHNADIEEFPYDSSIRINGIHTCGGSIISNQHILTAAHCITHNKNIGQPYDNVRISTGTSSSLLSGNSHRIHSVIVHPHWTDSQETSFDNDIAVIKLKEKIHFDESQQKIELADKDVVSKTIAIFSGWGHNVPKSGKNSIQLQKLKLKILDRHDCQPYHTATIRSKQFCAFHSPGHGSCFGDSGGPLVLDDRLIGVLSWGSDEDEEDCVSGTADIFVNVYAYKDFITSAMLR